MLLAFPRRVSFLRPLTRYLSGSGHNQRFRVAIVGTGPAGFYTAHHLLNKSNGLSISIDFYDRLPAPHGLSRYGVAPDHPEVKNCEEYMDNLMRDHKDNVRFFGNVNVGRDITLKNLQEIYHSIVLSYGCTSSDNRLDIPGADSPAVISARQFVNWYNSHPDSEYTKALIPPPLDKIENVTIIGNGNVAIDVARVLLADPTSHWAPTDISVEAVELLRKSAVKRVNIVARRGLLESAFTNKEIRELTDLSKNSNVRFIPIDSEIMNRIKPNEKQLSRVDKRKFSILEKASKEAMKLEQDPNCKQWALEFQKSPKEFVKDPEDPSLLRETVFEINELVQDSLTKRVSVKGTGETTTIPNELVILSIGYKGSPLEGFDEVGLAFDIKKNCLVHKGGRLMLKDKVSDDLEYNYSYDKGWYTSGWIKSGPRGVIATTMMESFDTANNILEDLNNGIFNKPNKEHGDIDLPDHAVTWEGWTKLDRYEVEEGQRLHKTRVKVPTVREMLKIAHA
ncbi:hypothetical protein CA7LBN_001816 [Candidozyma auris]|uniref:NADPH:adrenodoxin oxidoreductase, mitochondrial n=1 Tax=Candidozyma auris TaxID=498019 RepID=A0A8F2W0C3_CANAR|nr:hypothetical protein QG37_07776 [[Candida] auris]QWW23015.1 hypothetical protein CA7LBN_001816 [[Candida] auris]